MVLSHSPSIRLGPKDTGAYDLVFHVKEVCFLIVMKLAFKSSLYLLIRGKPILHT